MNSTTTVKILCSGCGLDTSSQYTWYHDGTILCQRCAPVTPYQLDKVEKQLKEINKTLKNISKSIKR